MRRPQPDAVWPNAEKGLAFGRRCAGRRMTQTITIKTLQDQNRRYADTAGISGHNRVRGFVPGFLDRATGRIYSSRNADGTPAAIHLLDGLPECLVVSRTASGQVAAVKGTVLPGFILDGVFYTREQLMSMFD